MNVRALPNWKAADAVVCIASGPSLTAADCARVRVAGAPSIVTNTTFRACPWADMVFAFDAAWWRVYAADVRAIFAGRRFCQSSRWPARDIEWPGAFRHYRSFGNSGACAVALAIAAGARRVILLGYDGRPVNGRIHHHGDHPAPLRNCDTMSRWPKQFDRLAAWARGRGVDVLNATPLSAFDQFPLTTLTREFAGEMACAA